MSFEENAGGLVPGELTTTVIGEYTYYGSPKLVDRVIEQWKKKKMQGHGDKGAFGEVFKLKNTLLSPNIINSNIGIDNKQYYVKRIIPKLYEMPSKKGQPIVISAKNEIKIANKLTAIVPDSVSNFKGARIRNSGYPVISEIEKAQHKAEDLIVKYKLEEFEIFIVFEGLEGISLYDACEKIKKSGKTDGQRLKDYATLFCSAKRAIESINTAGYIHGDIHNKNIIVIGDGDTAKCKLIDFGTTEKVAEVVYPKYTIETYNLVKNCIFLYFFTHHYVNFDLSFKQESQTFLELVAGKCTINGKKFATEEEARNYFKQMVEEEKIEALRDFFFFLCGKLIRMRDIPGQIARLNVKEVDKKKRLKDEQEECNTYFNKKLPPPTFLTPEGAVPGVPGVSPPKLSYVDQMFARLAEARLAEARLKGKGGKRRKTKRRKTKHRRTRRV